jgi:hypothetical protein
MIVSSAAKTVKKILRNEGSWETAEAVARPSFVSADASLKRGANERNFRKFASGFFEEKPRGDVPKTKPTKENRKDA